MLNPFEALFRSHIHEWDYPVTPVKIMRMRKNFSRMTGLKTPIGEPHLRLLRKLVRQLNGTTLEAMCCYWQWSNLAPLVFLRVIALCFQGAKCIPVTSPDNVDFVTLYRYSSIPSCCTCRCNKGPLINLRFIHFTAVQMNWAIPATLEAIEKRTYERIVSNGNKEEEPLRHVAMVAKFLDDNKPKTLLK